MNTRQTIVMLGLMLLCTRVSAQFSLGVEFRPRTEYRHGYKELAENGSDPAFFTSQRTRLLPGFEKEKFRFRMSLQDVRTWGSTAQLNVSDNFFSVHEAWGEVLLGKGFHLRLGRQELFYDDHRILGNVGWAQQGRSHDLGLLRWEKEGLKVHAGLAFNQRSEELSGTYYNLAGNYKTMQFVWFHTGRDFWQTSLLFVNHGLQVTAPADITTRFSQLIGTYSLLSLEQATVSLSAYYQMGKDVANKKISAYILAFDISFPLEAGPDPGFGMQVLSGTHEYDMNDPGEKNRSVNPLYGTNHKFNGVMDYFYVGNHLNSVGLIDLYGKLSWENDRFNAGVDIHYFRSHAQMRDTPASNDFSTRGLGLETDFAFGYKIGEGITASAGYSQMFPSRAMEVLKGGDHRAFQNWVWIMLSFNSEIFRSGG